VHRRRIGLAKSCFNLLNRGFWRSSISLPTKVQLYHTYIQPVLLYGSATWALTRALQDKVDAFDSMCLCRIFHIPYTDHVTNAPAVSAYPGQTASIFWTHGNDGYVTWHHSSTHKVSIWGLPKDWRCPPGRPQHTWLLTLEADLQPLNPSLNSAWKYTQDREHWKHIVETAMLQLGACSSWW